MKEKPRAWTGSWQRLSISPRSPKSRRKFSGAGRQSLTAIPRAWRPSHFIDDFPEGRRQAPRCEVKLRVSLSYDPSSTTVAELIGETRDLSEIGLAVRVPSNRIHHRY